MKKRSQDSNLIVNYNLTVTKVWSWIGAESGIYFHVTLYIRVSVYQSVVFTVVTSSFFHLMGGKEASFRWPALLNCSPASHQPMCLWVQKRHQPMHHLSLCVFVLNVTERMLQTDIQCTVRHAERKSHLLIGSRTLQHARDVLRCEKSSEKMHKYVLSFLSF